VARTSVVHIGVDHPVARTDEPSQPPGTTRLGAGAEAILCLGTDYRHKNRVFAIRMLEQMQRRHGWDGFLLLAGPSVAHGSSRQAEADLLGRDPRLARSVIDLGPVDEAGKAWLLRRAGLVIYPTTNEGFGLVPFEAANAGLPCMWAPGTSLSEILPDSAAEIVAWDADQSADRAVELLRDDRRREQNVAAVRAAGKDLTWDATAAHLLELYEAACDAPGTPAGAIQNRDGTIGWSLSEDALRLVGPGGELPSDVERPLLALATHPQIAGPLFGALKLGYRAAYRLRRPSRLHLTVHKREMP
jgi:glycosyltransferase involved in cell wall biosynthesis